MSCEEEFCGLFPDVWVEVFSRIVEDPVNKYRPVFYMARVCRLFGALLLTDDFIEFGHDENGPRLFMVAQPIRTPNKQFPDYELLTYVHTVPGDRVCYEFENLPKERIAPEPLYVVRDWYAGYVYPVPYVAREYDEFNSHKPDSQYKKNERGNFLLVKKNNNPFLHKRPDEEIESQEFCPHMMFFHPKYWQDCDNPWSLRDGPKYPWTENRPDPTEALREYWSCPDSSHCHSVLFVHSNDKRKRRKKKEKMEDFKRIKLASATDKLLQKILFCSFDNNFQSR